MTVAQFQQSLTADDETIIIHLSSFRGVWPQCDTNILPLLATPGAADHLPVHTAHLGDFLPELQALLTHFHLADHARELGSVADEMDLYGVASDVISQKRRSTVEKET